MKLTDAEWKLMNAIWVVERPASAREVIERLEGDADWAYTTVKTMLDRLVDKGALASSIRANTTLYDPLLERGEARRSAMRALLDNAFDGAFGPMMQFVVSDEEVPEDDRAELARLLRRMKRKGGGR